MEPESEIISLLARRDIEVRIVAPLVDAMSQKFGRPVVLEVLSRVVENMGLSSGREAALRVCGDSLPHLARGIEIWSRDGALELEHLSGNEERLFFNVRRCRYAEMYRELGLTELGMILSCGRDFAFSRGFNPRLKLQRTQTIMAGQNYCDFRFCLESGENDTP
ncbi:MAG: L-2-amino-thiazoline-4-carboxylic acid hydrolase [Desulfatirhabdiaceae bacterium]